MEKTPRPQQNETNNRSKSGHAAWEATKRDPARLAEFKRIRSEAMKKFWNTVRELKKSQDNT